MSDVRRIQDLEKLKFLCLQSHGKLIIRKTSGNPISKIEIESKFNAVPDSSYPSKVSNSIIFTIELLSKYPFVEPVVHINSKIYHPNIYTSGRICLGQKWLPTDKLDLFVKRILSIITYDANVLNLSSPANGEAANWYKSAYQKNPKLFPTDKLDFSSAPEKTAMSWNNLK
jgi:ubiquitin-protein ligase